MDLGNKTIEDWFLEIQSTEFPDNIDFVTKYKAIKESIQPLLSDATRGGDKKDEISLTWHDKTHIDTVIKRASKLLSYEKAELSPYEMYYLLVSVQIHDLGNMKGRSGHEARAIEILDGVYKNADSTERNIVSMIVETHSGDIDGDKDKISKLNEEVIHYESIRARYIAAILRFSDELADEPKRASIHLLQEGLISKGSEIHHLYAYCLTTTYLTPNSRVIKLNFTIDKEYCKKKYGKYDKASQSDIDVFLLEEIFERTLKVHLETMYCMRFLRPQISIERINVSIEVLQPGLVKKIPKIEYEMIEKGYPETRHNIYSLTGEQLKENGVMWTGELLKSYIMQKLDSEI